MSLGPEGRSGVSSLPLDVGEARCSDLAVDTLCCPGNSDWFWRGHTTHPEPTRASRAHAAAATLGGDLPPSLLHGAWQELVSGVQACTGLRAVGLTGKPAEQGRRRERT